MVHDVFLPRFQLRFFLKKLSRICMNLRFCSVSTFCCSVTVTRPDKREFLYIQGFWIKANWENLWFATNKMCKNCVSYIDKQKYLFSNNYTTLQNTYSQRWMVNVFILLLVYKWQKEMHNLCAKFLKQILNKSFVKPLVPYIWWLSVTTMSVK